MDTSLMDRLQEIAKSHCIANGPAHDYLHVTRVVMNARWIGLTEGANLDILVPAALLHELFNYPKSHSQSHRSGEVAATLASDVLRQNDCPPHLIDPITECIRVHPFSRGLLPETIEGQVLQDADRLDAIGAIGIARCFATCTEMSVPFYHPDDPFCRSREPDDKNWGVDHFYRKLLLIPTGLHTRTARQMAIDRIRLMEIFLAQLGQELQGEQ